MISLVEAVARRRQEEQLRDLDLRKQKGGKRGRKCGTLSAYTGGCRCAECRTAAREYEYSRRALKAGAR